MDKYDVYEILYRGFVFCAITIGMLYFVMLVSGVLSGLIGFVITIAMYGLWLMVVVGTGAYLTIVMKGTFRPREPDTIDDLISELEDDDITEIRIKEIIASIKVTELLKDGAVSGYDYERIQYAMKLAGERIEEIDGTKPDVIEDLILELETTTPSDDRAREIGMLLLSESFASTCEMTEDRISRLHYAAKLAKDHADRLNGEESHD